ncbi:MAG: hypothetical protein ABIP94_20930 [Planctomycetota bacterium]
MWLPVREPAGFPPTPRYSLVRDNETAVSAELGTVAFERRTGPTLEDCHLLSIVATTDVHQAHCAWLIASGGRRTRAACERAHAVTTFSSGTAALRRVVPQEQDSIEHDFAVMVKDLLQRKVLLDEDAKAAKPAIQVVLDDRRGNGRRDLPDPAELLRQDMRD